MLRFSYFRSDDGENWSLSGQLAGPWVDELRSVWSPIREHTPRAHAVVDLKDVTFIDESGEVLLAEMQHAGARLVGSGVEHKHLLANLSREGSRSLRRCLEYLCGNSGSTAGNPSHAEAERRLSAAPRRKSTGKP